MWMTYAEVAERRKNLGAGIVELHHKVGISAPKFGVGIWSQNRPEWQITGQSVPLAARAPWALMGPFSKELH